MTTEFQTGDWVRIKADAFPGTDEKMDMAARGLVGQLGCCEYGNADGDALWYWRTGNGYLHTTVLESEIELVERKMP